MSLLSSKSHFWPAKVTSVHQFLLATTSSLSKGVKRQFCLLKRQFCPVMILTSKLANSVKKLHLSVKTLRISFHLTYAGNKNFIPRRESAKAGPKGSICFYLYIYWYRKAIWRSKNTIFRRPFFLNVYGWGGMGWTEYQKCPSNFFILCGYIDHVYVYLYMK